MAHNLHYNESTGKYSFFSVKEKPWHGLGQIVSDYPTSREAIEHAGLDYRVEKRRLFTFDSTNAFGSTDIIAPNIEVPNTFATVRTDNDTVLGVVGRDYQVVQNRDVFSFFDASVGGDGILYETAGALGKGERIFITAKLPSYIRLGREDLIEQYRFLNVCEQVYAYSGTSPTQQTEEVKGTLFGAYNAITGYYQNLRSYKDEEAKLRSLLFGGVAQQRTQKAFQLCAEIAKDPTLLTSMN